ncbi:MAG: LPS assembly protein LptD [Piscirickettsiaceae bacterium]|nr:LPS assembly protein LptD [Piscirickettsiaceae bacterium]
MYKPMVSSAALLSCFGIMALAQSEFQHCDEPYDIVNFLPYMRNLENIKDGVSVSPSDIGMRHTGQQIESRRTIYDRNSNNILAQGDVIVQNSDIILSADQSEWSLIGNKGSMINVIYWLKETYVRGEALHVHHEDKIRTELVEATYTTCASRNVSWLLQASKIILYHEAAIGHAIDTLAWIGSIPIFYFPFLSFSLNNKRKSGLLAPLMGYGNKMGLNVRIPYYWNIASGIDVTFTPGYMSNRGLMLVSEFRYLSTSSKGQVDIAFFDRDDLKKEGDLIDKYYYKDRKYFFWHNHTNLSSRWIVNFDYKYIFDNEYSESFDSYLGIDGISTYPNRNIDVNYRGDHWNFTGALKVFQTFMDSNEPYRLLPELKLIGSLPYKVLGMIYGFSAEYINFDHRYQIFGQRIELRFFVNLPWRSSIAFITPRVEFNHTSYNIQGDIVSDIDNTPARALSIASVDSGLFFERVLSIGKIKFMQTLEPRIFYLHIRHNDQDALPNFDASIRTFNMEHSFFYNRFLGSDRIGDANQLSLSIKSRLVNQQTGYENLRATLGSIIYFSDRKVTLQYTDNTARLDSDMAFKITASIAKKWKLFSEIQWNPHVNYSSNISAIILRYDGNNGRLLNIVHRHRRDKIQSSQQINVSARMPFNKEWSVVGSWHRSLDSFRTLESLAGVTYEGCCWATGIVIKDYVNNDNHSLAIFFQIKLGGLGNSSRKATAQLKLERGIFGQDAFKL